MSSLLPKEQKHEPPPNNEKQEPLYFKNAFSSLQNFKNYAKYKFSADQWFGTVYMLAAIYSNFLSYTAGKNRQAVEPGKDHDDLSAMSTQKNKALMVSSYVFTFNNIWTLLSARRAIPPEGKNPLQRMWNALRHPQDSQMQATLVLALPFSIANIITNIRYGFFNGQKEELFSQKTLAITGILVMLMKYGNLFGKSADKHQSETDNRQEAETAQKTKEPDSAANKEKNQEPKTERKGFYPLQVLKTGWRDNKPQVLAAITALIGATAVLTEGSMKRRSMLDRLQKATTIGSPQWHSVKAGLEGTVGQLGNQETLDKIKTLADKMLVESHSQIKKGVVGIVMLLAGSFYQIDQLIKGQRKQQAIVQPDKKEAPVEQQSRIDAESVPTKETAPDYQWQNRLSEQSQSAEKPVPKAKATRSTTPSPAARAQDASFFGAIQPSRQQGHAGAQKPRSASAILNGEMPVLATIER